MRQLILDIIIISMLLAIMVITYVRPARSADCVPLNDVVASWKSEAREEQRAARQLTFLVCNPCSCLTSMSACYEYKASEARREEEGKRRTLDLIERVERYGVCERRNVKQIVYSNYSG